MIIFQHERNDSYGITEAQGGITIAIEELPNWILPTLEVGEFITKKVGIAVCSSKDRFCKKTGREIALSRMKSTKLTLSSLFFNESCSAAVFKDEQGNSYLFKKYPKAKSIFFVKFESNNG